MWGGRPKPHGHAISVLAKFMLKKLNQLDIFDKRISIYNYYAYNIRFGESVTAIKKNLTEGDSPFVFPMIIHSAPQNVRMRLQTELPGFFWPRKYAGIRLHYEQFDKTIDLANKVYYLSMQQDLSQEDLSAVVDKFNQITNY